MIASVQHTNERPKLIQLIHRQLTADDGAVKEFQELKLKLSRFKVLLPSLTRQVLTPACSVIALYLPTGHLTGQMRLATTLMCMWSRMQAYIFSDLAVSAMQLENSTVTTAFFGGHVFCLQYTNV